MEQNLKAGLTQPGGSALGQQAILEAAAGQGDSFQRRPPALWRQSPPPARCGSVQPSYQRTHRAASRPESLRPSAASRGGWELGGMGGTRRGRVSSVPLSSLESDAVVSAIGYVPASCGSAANSSAIAAWPSNVTCWCRPISAATPSNRRPALVVTGAFRPRCSICASTRALVTAQRLHRRQVVPVQHLRRRTAPTAWQTQPGAAP